MEVNLLASPAVESSWWASWGSWRRTGPLGVGGVFSESGGGPRGIVAGKSMEILALNGGFHGKTSWKPMENPWKILGFFGFSMISNGFSMTFHCHLI